MTLTLTTRYRTRANSNVGAYVATGRGMSRKLTSDQSLTSDQNHRRAAQTLADALFGMREYRLTESDSNDSGTERRWSVELVPTVDQRAVEFGVTIAVSAGTCVGAHEAPDGWGHDSYRVTLTRRGQSMSLTYRMGFGHHGSPPTLAMVLDSLASDAAGVADGQTFEQWADELGYDSDSRSAEATFRACQKQTRDLARVLGEENLRTLMFETARL